jgi:hypothetical protein
MTNREDYHQYVSEANELANQEDMIYQSQLVIRSEISMLFQDLMAVYMLLDVSHLDWEGKAKEEFTIVREELYEMIKVFDRLGEEADYGLTEVRKELSDYYDQLMGNARKYL